jgi:hypothetical protein
MAETVAHDAAPSGAHVFEEAPDTDALLSADLSDDPVAHPAQGCVVAALGAEAPRQRLPVRRAFARAARKPVVSSRA